MDLSYAIVPSIIIVVFALVWNRAMDWLEKNQPDWKKTPNFFSVSVGVGMMVVLGLSIGAVVGDPLAMTKLQAGLFGDVLGSARVCSESGGTPVFSMECRAPNYVPPSCGGNYTDWFINNSLLNTETIK